MPDPTLPPLPPGAWPDVLADLENAYAGRLNVYRTMAHHPALMRAWEALRQHIVRDSSLGPARSEVVILRAATRLNSAYEWAHHVIRARTIGLTDARIAALRGPLDAMDPDDAVIAGAVDELLSNARLAPETLASLTALTGTRGVLDLFATVGFYSTLAFIVNTHDTPLDADVAAAIATQPLAAQPKDHAP